MAGVRIGVSYSAVSAAREEVSAEADALINIEAEHAPGRCDNFFSAGFFAGEISADSAGHLVERALSGSALSFAPLGSAGLLSCWF